MRGMNVIDQLKLLSRLFAYAKKGKISYFIGILGVASQSFLFNYAFALALEGLTRAAVQKDVTLLRESLIMLAISLLTLTILMPLFSYLFDGTTRKMTGNVRKDLFSHIQRLPMITFEKHHSADMLSRLNNDVQIAENAYGWPFALLLMSAIAGLGSSVVIFTIDYRIAIAAVIIGFGNMVVNSLFARPIRKLSETAQEKLSESSQRLSDILAGFKEAKIYNINKTLFKKYFEASNGLLLVSMKRAKWQSAINSINWLLIMMNFIGIITFGGFLVVFGQLEFSSLIKATQMMNGVIWMFSAMGSFYAQVQSSLAGANRVFEIIDLPAEDEGKDNLSIDYKSSFIEARQVIEFDSVSFAYNGDNPVLSEFDASIRKSEKVALVGLSGSGKSTIFKLILGFYTANGGNVRVFGKPVSDYGKAELRSLTAYVPQDSYMFEGTIRENILYGKMGASDDDVTDAAKAAFAHDFIVALPKGYDTEVGERGSKLSGGERQRLAIARAFLKDAPILLLDEATASLDSESEQQVQKALEVLMKGRNCLVIAHRLSTIKNTDRILVVDNGKVTEEGNHASLVSMNGLYANLYEKVTKGLTH